MEPSLFAAIRIVAHVLVVDGKFDIKERKWFSALVNGFGVTAQQRDTLSKDLEHPGDIADLHKEVYRLQDRDCLLRWANAAMNSNGFQHPTQKQMCTQIRELNEVALKNDNPNLSQAEYAEAILQADNEKRLWGELKEAGDFYSQRVPVFMPGARMAVDMMFIQAFLSRNRFIFWTLILFFVVYTLVRIFARYL